MGLHRVGSGQTCKRCPVVFTCGYIGENSECTSGKNISKITRVWMGEAHMACKLEFNILA